MTARVLWLADGNSAHTRRWIEALYSRGFTLAVFSLAAVEDDWFRRFPGLHFASAGVSPSVSYARDGRLTKAAYLLALPRLIAFVRNFRPQLSHAHYASSYGVVGAILRLRPRIISIWGADVYTTPLVSPLHRSLIAWALRGADLVLSTSATMREHARRLVDRSIDVLPFGVDVGRFAPAHDASHRRQPLTIGTVKTLDRKYGIEYLIRAFALLQRRQPIPQTRLLVAGQGPLRAQLEALTAELGLGDAVTFIGAVTYDRVHEVHQQLDIAAYPSIDDSESFGVSVVESQACAVPVVVSRVGGLPEVVDEGVSGLVVPPGDVEALSAALARLVADDALRVRMGLAGRRRVEERFSLDACVDRLVEHYERLIQSGR